MLYRRVPAALLTIASCQSESDCGGSRLADDTDRPSAIVVDGGKSIRLFVLVGYYVVTLIW